jgi:hypothetical protein
LPDTSTRVPAFAALAFNAANEARAVELVAEQCAVGAQQDRVARASDASGGCDLVHQPDRRYLVRHRNQRTTNVRELEYRLQGGWVVLGLHAHRHHDRVNAVLLEPGVVDQRRLETLGRIAEVGDEGGLATDHGCLRGINRARCGERRRR